MNFRLMPLGAMVVAASAGAQSVPTPQPDGSILINGVYYFPSNPGVVGPVVSAGSGPIIVGQPSCALSQAGCITVGTGGGNDTVEAGSGSSTISGGSGSDVIVLGGGPVSGIPTGPVGPISGAPADPAGLISNPPSGSATGPKSGTPAAPASTVPEPGSWATMVLGFAFVGGALRRRRMSAPRRST